MPFCDSCDVRTEHSKQIALVTAPTILVLQPVRAAMRGGRFSRHKVVPELSISLPGIGNYELAAVVYHRGSSPLSGHYYAVVKAHDDRWWMFDDDDVRCFNEDVEQYRLPLVHLCFYVRPRGTVTFSDEIRFGDASAAVSALDFKAAVEGISAWNAAEWERCVRAYINGRRGDVHVVASIEVEDAIAAELRCAFADDWGGDIERIFRDLVIAARGDAGDDALANYDWQAFARAFAVFLQGCAKHGSGFVVPAASSTDLSAAGLPEVSPGDAPDRGDSCISATESGGQPSSSDPFEASHAPRLKRYRGDSRA